MTTYHRAAEPASLTKKAVTTREGSHCPSRSPGMRTAIDAIRTMNIATMATMSQWGQPSVTRPAITAPTATIAAATRSQNRPSCFTAVPGRSWPDPSRPDSVTSTGRSRRGRATSVRDVTPGTGIIPARSAARRSGEPDENHPAR